jgi:predicted nucleic acid-binding Zn ribbon protein
MRKCEVCSESLQGKRRDAVYCSAACKQYAHRKRRKAASAMVPGVATVTDGASFTATVPVPAVITIREPGKPRREQPDSPPAAPLVA